MAVDDGLPAWASHPAHPKNVPLTDEEVRAPEPYLRQFLERARAGRPRAEVRVLDVGCGRGETVAWLLREGWDAYGHDIAPAYVENGNGFLAASGFGSDRLRSGTPLPFQDDAFDAVLSQQVIEHVQDLPAFVAELARVSRPGALGLHVFPARYGLVESHVRVPLVHWLPVGRPRRWLLRGFITVGLADRGFADFSAREQTEILGRGIDEDTCYRTTSVLARAFRAAGADVDAVRPTREKVALRWPALPPLAVRAVASAYRRGHQVYLSTRQG